VLGADASVTADLTARAITIGGTVVGSVIATERAAITETGCVEGDVRAPRVQMADGAVFGGRVDTIPLPIEPVVPDPSSAPVADLPPATRPCASEQHV
jgi:cytoskeletal protein CcmA (bactofilin family)